MSLCAQTRHSEKRGTHSGESALPQFWHILPVLELDAREPESDDALRDRSECTLPRLRRSARRYSFSSRNFLFMFWTAPGERALGRVRTTHD